MVDKWRGSPEDFTISLAPLWKRGLFSLIIAFCKINPHPYGNIRILDTLSFSFSFFFLLRIRYAWFKCHKKKPLNKTNQTKPNQFPKPNQPYATVIFGIKDKKHLNKTKPKRAQDRKTSNNKKRRHTQWREQ